MPAMERTNIQRKRCSIFTRSAKKEGRSTAASRLTAKSPMACKASFSTKSPTASPCGWPSSISVEESRRDMSATIIRNGRVIDPANKRDEIADLLIVDGKITPLSQLSTLNPQPDEIDASDFIVCHGLIDMHVHLRELGFSHNETVDSR